MGSPFFYDCMLIATYFMQSRTYDSRMSNKDVLLHAGVIAFEGCTWRSVPSKLLQASFFSFSKDDNSMASLSPK
jgi:hypothetical protein